MPKNILAVVETDNSHLVVFDDAMGRNMHRTGKSYDFDKFKKALNYSCIKSKDATLVDIGANIGSICIEALVAGYFDQCIAQKITQAIIGYACRKKTDDSMKCTEKLLKFR